MNHSNDKAVRPYFSQFEKGIGVLPTVSIVTISYNQKNYLERCLQSVLSQTYKNIEYIVVDGGSSDGSSDILRKYESLLAKLIIEPDQGPADALNKGFGFSTGQIFGFLNSDDELAPFAVADVVESLGENQNWDVVSGHSLLVDEEGRLLRRVFSDRFTIRRGVSGAAFLMQPSTFFRRNSFERAGGFNINNRTAWDFELWFDMALTGSIFGILDSHISIYRLHNDSITGSEGGRLRTWKHLDDMFRKVFDRSPTVFDRSIQTVLRTLRHLQNPRGTVERILYGKIADRMGMKRR